VRTGEINADRVLSVIRNENVNLVLIHSEGKLFYPYGSELYYYEAHHLKKVKDYNKLQKYLDDNFILKKRFESPNGPVFVLYQKKE
ncbi:MAG: hypothetical protein N3B13_08900, partial [Deltaproteobacteria bacterium]|nr:hypothetical protein [Deltaproteobacteria bacterium]